MFEFRSKQKGRVCMGWLIAGSIGIAILVFWLVYDRVTERKANVHPLRTVTELPERAPARKQAAWICPVCGMMHGAGGGRKSTDTPGQCPFKEDDYYKVSEDNKPESTYTHTGAHFELPYMLWRYDGMIYITYTPKDDHSVLHDKYGALYVSAYYSARYCRAEEWQSDEMIREIDQDIWALRQKVVRSIYESGDEYIVGLDRILDMSVTKEPGCARTGYVVWQGEQGIFVTGMRTGASEDIFNYDRISRSCATHRYSRFYTRKLCSTLDELRGMPRKEIDRQAYEAYMDGAK